MLHIIDIAIQLLMAAGLAYGAYLVMWGSRGGADKR